MIFKSSIIRRAVIGLTISGSVLFSQATFAFADDDARKAIVDLRQQIKVLTDANQRARIQLADQIEGLEQEVARLRGEMEQLTRPGGSGGGASAAGGGRAPDAQSQDPREQSAFNQSMETFRKGQYKETIQNLTAFMTLYPDSTLGLVEVLFAQLLSWRVFLSKSTGRETLGIVLIVAGVACLLLTMP